MSRPIFATTYQLILVQSTLRMQKNIIQNPFYCNANKHKPWLSLKNSFTAVHIQVTTHSCHFRVQLR